MHPHCWVLLDRVIGHELVEMSLKRFLKAIEQFWQGNSKLFLADEDQFDRDYDDPFHSLRNRLEETPEPIENGGIRENLFKQVDTWRDPVNVPEIQALVEQAVQQNPRDDHECSLVALDVPLEIAVMIVDMIYNSIDYNQESIIDTRNLLSAFQWKLPDSYWQNRCKRDSVFEFEDLIMSNNKAVD